MPRKYEFREQKYDGPIATALRRLIQREGIRQEDLAQALQLTRQAINNYTLGTSVPSLSMLCALADYFGVSTDYLLGRTKVETDDTSIRAIAEYTGLTEENIQLSMEYRRRNPIFSECINDMVALSDLVLVDYVRMKYALQLPPPAALKNSSFEENLLELYSASEKSRSLGYAQLTGRETFLYHCGRISEEITRALEEKYIPTAKWRTEDGNN